MGSGAPNGSVPQNICSSGQVLLAGKFGKINVLGSKVDLVYTLACMFYLFISPPPHWRGECLPYAPPDCLCTPPPPPSSKLKGWILPCIHTQGALRCTSLVGNSSISLTGSQEQINSSQQSSKMLKMSSGIFIYAFLLFLRLFLKFPVGCLCGVFAEENKWKIQDPFLHIIFFLSLFVSHNVNH